MQLVKFLLERLGRYRAIVADSLEGLEEACDINDAGLAVQTGRQTGYAFPCRASDWQS